MSGNIAGIKLLGKNDYVTWKVQMEGLLIRNVKLCYYIMHSKARSEIY